MAAVGSSRQLHTAGRAHFVETLFSFGVLVASRLRVPLVDGD